MDWITIGTIAGAVLGFILLVLLLMARFYRKVNQGEALIVSKLTSRPIVTFTGTTVLPIIHRAEIMDISLKTIEVARQGGEGLICKDNMRADIRVSFYVRVNKLDKDVLNVAQAIGCKRASDQRTLEDLFIAKFSEALKTVGKAFEFVELYEKRKEFKDAIIVVIGEDLNGYVLEDAAIDYLEQTPVEQLDKNNILDAEGIRKITDITASEAVLTNNLRQEEAKAIKKKNVEAAEAIFELEKREADAKAKQLREIASIQAREQAETLRIQAEEKSKAEQARIKAEEEIAIQNENRLRQVEVAQKNRERVVGIEAERVDKDRALEALGREREVELQRIAKDKALEVERKEIADVIRSRIAVEKTVAEEEERIKDLRAHAEAERRKKVTVVAAEAEAEESLVKHIKAAEAKEQVAKLEAKEILVRADADLEASDKQARAKIRLAEGTQAEVAAEGLAAAKVKEAEAIAIEKQGAAEAKVTLQKMEAVAVGEEKQGLARVKVQEAEAAAIEKTGLAEAQVAREKLVAEAAGEQEKGLAGVRVAEAEAAAIQKKGEAHAAATKDKLVAEAEGLKEKAEAMKALDGVGREHEEFRLELEKDKEIKLAHVDVQRDIAMAQAEVLSEAFKKANINIVGGDGEFFDQFIKSVSVGKSVDGVINQSDVLKTVLADYLAGRKSLPEDVKQLVAGVAASSGSLSQLSVTALLTQLAAKSDGTTKKKLGQLMDTARQLGLDDDVAKA